jgi:sialic acid synthase SpsE
MISIRIGGEEIGDNNPTYVVAEAGVNHNGSLSRAKRLIKEAAKAGADAIKFQTYKAEKLVTKTAPRFWDWEGEDVPDGTQYDSYSKLDTLPESAYPEMVKECRKNKIEFLSTPFDSGSADFLDNLGMPAFKMASADLTNLPFLEYIAEKGKPMIVSTGLATLGEIEDAVRVINNTGNKQIILLHCILSYPTKPEDANLRMIQTLQNVFSDIPIGISDHSIGITIPTAAVTLGARLVEKHYTIDKKLLLSADHWFSVDPSELAQMVENIRTVEKALGSRWKRPLKSEELALKYARRSIVAAKDIKRGEKITEEMLDIKRPGTGITPNFYNIIVGRTARRDIKADTLIQWTDI